VLRKWIILWWLAVAVVVGTLVAVAVQAGLERGLR
jgi:hypothetical protein